MTFESFDYEEAVMESVIDKDWEQFWTGDPDGWALNRAGFPFESNAKHDKFDTKRSDEAEPVYRAGFRDGVKYALNTLQNTTNELTPLTN
jgi:hypothetical protein